MKALFILKKSLMDPLVALSGLQQLLCPHPAGMGRRGPCWGSVPKATGWESLETPKKGSETLKRAVNPLCGVS